MCPSSTQCKRDRRKLVAAGTAHQILVQIASAERPLCAVGWLEVAAQQKPCARAGISASFSASTDQAQSN